MVKLELTTEQAQLLVTVIDSAPVYGTVGQANEVLNALQQILDIRNQLVAQPEVEENANR
jgi:soluble cytochrome b562